MRTSRGVGARGGARSFAADSQYHRMALTTQAERGHDETVTKLLSLGANVEHESTDGSNALCAVRLPPPVPHSSAHGYM